MCSYIYIYRKRERERETDVESRSARSNGSSACSGHSLGQLRVAGSRDTGPTAGCGSNCGLPLCVHSAKLRCRKNGKAARRHCLVDYA